MATADEDEDTTVGGSTSSSSVFTPPAGVKNDDDDEVKDTLLFMAPNVMVLIINIYQTPTILLCTVSSFPVLLLFVTVVRRIFKIVR